MADTRTSIAVIGCGYWGPNLIRAFGSLSKARLAAVCDVREEIAREVVGQAAPGTAVVTDYTDILANPEIDAVAIATPAATHHALVWDALSAGKHVFVEKPLAVTTTQACQLRDLAVHCGRILMVGHIFMYNAAVLKIREYIASGEIGEIRHINARRLNLGRIQTDHNALWSFAPHELSILNYWLGEEPATVAAQGFSYLHPGIEDIVFVSLRYGSGVGASLHLSWLDPQKVREITVVGTEGMIIYDDTSPTAKIQIVDKKVSREVIDSDGRMRVSIHAAGSVVPELEFQEPLLVEAAHFVDCVESGSQPRSDGDSGVRVVRAIEAAERSMAQGGIQIPLVGADEEQPALAQATAVGLG